MDLSKSYRVGVIVDGQSDQQSGSKCILKDIRAKREPDGGIRLEHLLE